MKEERSDFRIASLPTEFASTVRGGGLDAQGNPGVSRRDSERHQCRQCLTLSLPDETVLLASYRPFPSSQPYAEYGPIFIHQRECEPYVETSAYPPEFPHHTVVIRAYSVSHEIEAATLVGPRRVEDVIAELFENPRVSYLHARNSEYGCFMFRIERAVENSVPS